MAIRQFPRLQYWKVHATGEVVAAGAIQVAVPQRLGAIKLTVYKHGTEAGTERFRVKLFHDLAQTKLYATSQWVSFEAVNEYLSSPMGQYWRGTFAFEFARPYPNLSTSSTYYVAVESDGYTRNDMLYYVAWCLDWPLPVYNNPAALQMQIFSRIRQRMP